MHVNPIQSYLVSPGTPVETVIKDHIHQIHEGSVLVIASKLFSYAENRFVKKNHGDKSEKWELAKKEAEWWLDPNLSKYQCMLTIKGGWMFANAGIDESNSLGNDAYVLWPKDPQKAVNKLWNTLRQHYKVQHLGIIMSDSISFPLNWGVIGHAIAYCGFEALKSYIGTPDLYGRLMTMEQTNIAQSLVTAGTYVMGEGAEQTPIALIQDIPHIVFQDNVPSQDELNQLRISKEDDIYAPLLTMVPWKKGLEGND